jgi:polar amino acid transport system substrate-binding protein
MDISLFYIKEEFIMLKKILFVSAILLLICFSFSCSDKAENTIIFATDATWPPMEFLDEKREIVGFEIDLFNLVAKEGGFKAEFKNTAWDGIFAGLATGEYDAVLSSVTITEDRQKTMDFSIPYINAGQVLIVGKETTGVTTLDDLKGSAVGAQIGTTGAFEVEKVDGVELKTYDELGLAIEDLTNKRIAGVVADTPIAADYVLQNDTYKDKLMIVGKPFTEELYGVAVKKGNSEVLEKINKGLQKVLDTDDYEQLKKKWLQ